MELTGMAIGLKGAMPMAGDVWKPCVCVLTTTGWALVFYGVWLHDNLVYKAVLLYEKRSDLNHITRLVWLCFMCKLIDPRTV